jgi:hypothetical protein
MSQKLDAAIAVIGRQMLSDPRATSRLMAYEKCLQHAAFLVVDLVRAIEAVIAPRPFDSRHGRQHRDWADSPSRAARRC